jgi:RNA-directed DNA polymerase
MRAKLRVIKQQLRERMHDPVPQTGKWLQSVVQGYFNYHAVPGNLGRLGVFRVWIARYWRRTLRRRGQRRPMNWARLSRLLDRWLPKPRVLHPYPAQRFAATHSR